MPGLCRAYVHPGLHLLGVARRCRAGNHMVLCLRVKAALFAVASA